MDDAVVGPQQQKLTRRRKINPCVYLFIASYVYKKLGKTCGVQTLSLPSEVYLCRGV